MARGPARCHVTRKKHEGPRKAPAAQKPKHVMCFDRGRGLAEKEQGMFKPWSQGLVNLNRLKELTTATAAPCEGLNSKGWMTITQTSSRSFSGGM